MIMKNLEKRIKALENKSALPQGYIPSLVHISGLPDSKTFEEAKAEYKQLHGFDLLEDAPVLELVLNTD